MCCLPWAGELLDLSWYASSKPTYIWSTYMARHRSSFPVDPDYFVSQTCYQPSDQFLLLQTYVSPIPRFIHQPWSVSQL